MTSHTTATVTKAKVQPMDSSVPLVLKDLTAARNEFYVSPPAALSDWLVRTLLADPRDAPILWLHLNVLVVVPLAAALLMWVSPSHLYGTLYIATVYALFTQRFILALHFGEHRRIFKARGVVGALLNGFPCFVMAPFFGFPPGLYRIHHIAMHHAENNRAGRDLSSTEPYQRDNFLHFLHYLLRYACLGLVEVPYYAWSTKRYRMLSSASVSLVLWVFSYQLLARVNATAALYMLVVPFFVTSLLAMFGNWSQHIFVDPKRARNNYALTYDVIDHFDNQATYNDGYHIEHHVNSLLHWSELPTTFLATLPKHAAEDSLIFRNISVFEVGVCVMTGRLHTLADCYVNIGQPKRTKDELIALMKDRLRPVPANA